jgi:hypothetical protein
MKHYRAGRRSSIKRKIEAQYGKSLKPWKHYGQEYNSPYFLDIVVSVVLSLVKNSLHKL